MALKDALKEARSRGLDLIEIAPQAQPPVVKIVNFDKFRYQQEKKERKKRIHRKDQEVKQAQISLKAAHNDLLTKAKQINNFLDKGYLVRIIMVLKGREKAHREFAQEKLQQFLKEMISEHKIISPPKFGGRGITIQIQKKK